MNNLMMEVRDRSNVLHKATENTGFTKRLINENATIESYAECMYNLYYVYQAIEDNLESFKDIVTSAPFATTELYRSDFIK